MGVEVVEHHDGVVQSFSFQLHLVNFSVQIVFLLLELLLLERGLVTQATSGESATLQM